VLFVYLFTKGSRVIRIHSREPHARQPASLGRVESDLKIEILMRWSLVLWH
jgi:hypothetical protein